jgi:hypothetical protein
MATGTTDRPAGTETSAAAKQARALDPADVAWLAAVPCALAIVLAIWLLGPPAARLLPQAAGSAAYWPGEPLAPEPVEHARYGIALLGPLLLAAVVLVVAARPVALAPSTVRALELASGAVATGFLALCLLAQNSVLLHANVPPAHPNRFFDVGTLLVAAALAGLLVAGLRQAPTALRRLVGGDERRALRLGCLALAALLTAAWLLTAINSDATVADARGYDLIPWDMTETFAILDGRTPLADFHSQYSQLWPYLSAIVLALFGSTILVWTTTMATISGLALLAVYATFRRLVRSSLLALALYLPFLAFGFFILIGPASNRFSTAGIFSAWPMRYAGPYLLAWLLARHADDAAPRRAWLLFAAAGLVAINNPELGLGALAGAILGVACLRRPTSLRAAAQLLGTIAAGVGFAVVFVSLLTLVRSGSLPHFGWVLEFPHLYGVDGWFVQPMAPIGLQAAMYATFSATLVFAVVRAIRGSEEPVLTALLAWSGPFGLLAGSYYVGASNPLTLGTLFSAWCFALVLLVVAVVRALVSQPRRLPSAPALAVLFGFGLAVCAIPQFPMPGPQLARLDHHVTPIYEQRELVQAIRDDVRHGEKVAILFPLGHRVAYDLGVVNVAPYSGPAAMPTKQQLETTIDVMRHEHARKAFVDGEQHAEYVPAFQRAGFTVVSGSDNPVELVDER